MLIIRACRAIQLKQIEQLFAGTSKQFRIGFWNYIPNYLCKHDGCIMHSDMPGKRNFMRFQIVSRTYEIAW